MKKIRIFLICFGAAQSLCLSQHVTFSRQNNGTNQIIVPAGEVWQVVNWCGYGSGGTFFYLPIGGENTLGFSGTSSQLRSLENPTAPIGLIIQGPATLIAGHELSWPHYSYLLVFKKLSSSNSISATSVVIPSSAVGDVDVKMEQSADNVTWTECLPGTYNSSTVKRFFRLRAVEK